MKILFCYPPVSEDYEKIRDAGVSPHLSLLCLGTHIKNSFNDVEVDLCDGHHTNFEKICEKIIFNNYDIIGFSVDFTNYNTSVKLAKFAKSVNPKIKIGCGSNHASNMYKQILTNQKSYDFVGINDGEEQWQEYIRYCKGEISIHEVPNLAYREDGIIKMNPLKTFNLLKMYPVEYELMDLKVYFELQERLFGKDFKMLQFTSQRGCANHPLCVFCGRYNDGMRFRNPKEFAKEVAYYTEKYSLTEVWDRSDSFIQNVKWLKEFANVLNSLTNRFKTGQTTFKTYSRADQLLRQDVIDVLKSLHFRMVFIGYEAGDDRILKNVGKNSNTQTYEKATKKVFDNGIDIDASFIVGLPGENKESMKNHINFVKKLNEMGLDKIRVNRLLVLPGTPLYRKIVEKFPEIADKDIVPMNDLQKMIFQTDLYDLSEFDNDVNKYIEALLETAHIMTEIVSKKGGVSEGYGHGKGKNILEGKELEVCRK
ncbi:MAG: radical SAM protein [Clostridia bacterium]|nr:radical SAM protein [Clostridia bacterium]